MILSGVVMALSMKRRHFVEENVATQADMTRDKQICEREILVCVYWFVAMGIYLMICSEVTVCIPSVADASYGGSVGNATFSY